MIPRKNPPGPVAAGWEKSPPRRFFEISSHLTLHAWQSAEAARQMRQSEAVIAASDAVREIAKALRNHIDPEALEKIANDLLDVPGDKIFRETIAQFTDALMTPPDGRL